MNQRSRLFPLLFASCLAVVLLLAVSCIAPVPAGPSEEPAAEEPAAEEPADDEPAAEEPAAEGEPTASAIEQPLIPASEIAVVCRGAPTEVTFNECVDPLDSTVYTYTAIDRAAACVPIVPFDPNLAWEFTEASPGLYQIGWTFGVNFEMLRGGNPVGCLRMWARDDVNHTYVPIDQGGILADTCSHPVASPSYGDGAATFTGSESVDCRIDLDAWITQPNLLDAVSDPSGALSISEIQARLVALAGLGGLVYDNFAIVAAPTWYAAPDCGDAVECLEPLMAISSATAANVTQALFVAWQPEPPPDMVAFFDSDSALYDRSGDPCQPMTVTVGDLSPNGALDEQLHGTEDVPPMDAPEWPRFWWMMPSAYDIGEPTADAEYRYQSTVESPLLTWICLEPEKGASTFFDMTQSWLVIGADPNTDATFQGVLEGVLIDPSDSKPPE